MPRVCRGAVVTFIVWLLFHVAHDAVWLAIGRFTDWNMQGTIFGILVVTLLMTFVSRWLGKFFPHGH